MADSVIDTDGPTLKGILLDFGGTLAYIDEVENRRFEEALVSTLSKYQYRRYRKELDSVLADLYVSSTKGEMKSLQEFWSLALKKLGISEKPELINDLESVRHDHAARVWKLYEGVPETLYSLTKKYKLALVSNCAIGTDKLIKSLDLARFFRCLTLSYEVGVRKPNKHIYLEALKCLELEANECIFVADEISDLEGARDVGLKTMLVKQGSDTFKEAKDTNFKPDYEYDNLADITKFL